MATFDLMGSFDLNAVQKEVTNVADTLSDLHDSFKSSVADVFGAIDGSLPPGVKDFAEGLSDSILHPTDYQTLLREQFRPSEDVSPDGRALTYYWKTPNEARVPPDGVYFTNAMRCSTPFELAKRMYDGVDMGNGKQTVGLERISQYKLDKNSPYYRTNLNQQSGYAAEVLSTAVENLHPTQEREGLTTYRADDRPDLGFKKNDQFVDKIRVNDAGEVVERIQTKFVGKNGADWVSKIMDTKRYDKYFEGDRVDKIECPKNFYEEAKAAIPARLEDLQEQLEHTLADGKTDAINMIQRKIEKLTKLDDMIEKSVITKQEAIDARLKPRMATSKLVADGVLPDSINEGLHGAAFTSGLTFVSSTVIHGREFFEGDISAQELASAVALETGAAGAIDGVSDFVSTAVGTAMRGSSHELIQSVGGSVLPAVAVSFAVESYDSISDYAQGLIDGNELAYELGENAATIGGGALAGAKIGAVAGTFAGPVGSVVGGIAGGLVGSMVASEAYLTAAEVAPGACQEIAEGIEGFTSSTMEAIGREFPDSVDSARASFNDFFESNNIPVRA